MDWSDMSSLTYGVHEWCPVDVMPEGWILYLVETGDYPDPHPGIDLGDDPRTPIMRWQWLLALMVDATRHHTYSVGSSSG